MDRLAKHRSIVDAEDLVTFFVKLYLNVKLDMTLEIIDVNVFYVLTFFHLSTFFYFLKTFIENSIKKFEKHF